MVNLINVDRSVCGLWLLCAHHPFTIKYIKQVCSCLKVSLNVTRSVVESYCWGLQHNEKVTPGGLRWNRFMFIQCVTESKGRAESGQFLRATRIDPLIVKPKKDRWPFLLSCFINQTTNHTPKHSSGCHKSVAIFQVVQKIDRGSVLTISPPS